MNEPRSPPNPHDPEGTPGKEKRSQAETGSGQRPPGRIGRFLLRGLLGSGTSGSVYRAHDPRLARDVALKVAHPGTLQSPRDVARFLREARAAGNLRHPNIVPIYDAGQANGQHYLAAAFIEGSNLARALETGTLDVRRKAAVVRQVAEALAHAHRKGIAHRDVKPANVLLDARGRAYLADFGLAHREHHADRQTRDGQIFGSVAYLAPERIEGADVPFATGDQYSLGVVLYECLTGRAPFEGAASAILYQATHGQPAAPRTLDRNVPRDLESICLKALRRRPEDRYPSCQELADDLRRWLDDEPVHARPPGPLERSLRWARREPGLAAASAAALLALLAVILVPVASAVRLNLEVNRQEAAQRQAEAAAEEAVQATEQVRREEQHAAAAAAQLGQATQDQERAAAAAERKRQEYEATAAKARQARRDVDERRALSPNLKYASDVLRAWEDYRAEKLERVAETLAPYRATGGRPDLRGFEWFWLERRLRTIPPRCRFASSGSLTGSRLRWKAGRLIATTATDTILIDSEGLSPNQVARSILRAHQQPGGTPLSLLDPAAEGRFHALRASPTTLQLSGGVTLSGFSVAPTVASFSGDGQRLATFHREPTLDPRRLYLWDLAERRLLLRFDFGIRPLGLLKVSPRGNLLATTGGATHVWRATSSEPLYTLAAGTVRQFAFAPDESLLATATDAEVRLWDMQTGKQRSVVRPLAVPQDLSFSADGRWLLTAAAGDKGGAVQVWDVRKGSAAVTVEGAAQLPGGVVLSAQGKVLAVLEKSGASVSLWRVPEGSLLAAVPLDRPGPQALAFSENGERLAVLYQDARLQVWRRAEFEPALFGRGSEGNRTLAVTEEEVLAGDSDGVLRRWKRKEGAMQTKRLAPPPGRWLALQSGGSRLAGGQEDGSVRVWETTSGKEVLVVAGTGKPVRALALARTGRLAVARGSGIDLVDERGLVFAALPAGEDVCALAWSAEGGTLLSGDGGGKLVLWDVATLKARFPPIRAHAGRVGAVACCPDGRTIVSGGQDGQVRLWQLATGRELLTLAPGLGANRALAFDDRGTVLAAAAAGRVRLWHAGR